MSDQTKFIEASAQERRKMSQFFEKYNLTSFNFTPDDGYDSWDGFFTGKTGTEVIFEVKVRDLKVDTYSTTIIEAQKVEAILKASKEYNHTPFIFFFFNEDTLMIQPLYHDVHYSKFILPCPATTMGRTEMIDKEMVEFPIDKAKIYIINQKNK